MKIVFFAAIFIAGFFTASAQSTNSANQSLTLILPNSFKTIIGFGLDANNTSVTIADLQNSSTNQGRSDFQVKSKHSWSISVSAVAENFSSLDLNTKSGSDYYSDVNKISVIYTASQE